MDRLPSSQSGVRRRRLRLESAAACKTESGRWRCLDSWKWDRQRVGRRPGKRWGAVYTARAGKGNCCRRARNIWNTSAGEKSRERKRESVCVCVCVRARERERKVCRKRRVELRLVVKCSTLVMLRPGEITLWLERATQRGGGGGGFRLKPQMKVSFVWMWPYRILDARAQKECSWRAISWLAGAQRVIIAALATSRPSTETTFVKFVAAFSSLLLVWFASGDMKSERPSKDDEQHCRCVVWEEKTVLRSLDVAFSAPSRKFLALSFASFIPAKADVDWLCFKEILALAERESERFSPWQSENYYLWQDLRATECPTDKNGESWGMRLCHVFEDRPRIACVHACVPS